MKHLTKPMPKILFSCLLAGFFLLGAMTIQAEETALPDYSTANMDIVDGEEIIMPVSSEGAVVDGYQLNHDYVKILNINNGPIVINDEQYTQNGVTEPWSTQEDAYVIKGKGTSANIVTITPTANDIYIYLIDLSWSGQITINGSSPSAVHLIVCGDCSNTSTGQAIYNELIKGKLYVEGLTSDRENTFQASNTFLLDYSDSATITTGKETYISNVAITTDFFINRNATYLGYGEYGYYDNKLLVLTNAAVYNRTPVTTNGYVTINMSHSILSKFGLPSNQMSLDYCEIMDIPNFRSGSSVEAKDSDINYSVNVTNATFDLINSTLRLSGAAQSTLTKINMTDSCLYSAVNYAGTPVNSSANDLYLKKIRLRDFPNTYVWITVDHGTPSRLKTDSNGFLYPYVMLGTTSISAATEDGREYSATFPATEGTDTKTTNLLPVQKSSPSVTWACENQNLLVGDKLNIAIEALPGTAGRSLTYQWYKDGNIISGATGPHYLVLEAISRDSGVYKCVVKEDGGGTAVSDNIYVTVSKPAAQNQPVITSQTANMELVAGSSVTLVVAAKPAVSTDALSYQWYKDETAIEGAQSDSLVLANVQPEQAGSYYCIVTEENFNTTIESAPVIISIKE